MTTPQRLDTAPFAPDDLDSLCATENDTTLTWRRWNTDANRLASSLQRLGIGQGDVVAVRVRTRIEWLTISLAIAKLEAVIVAVNYRLSRPKAYGLDDVMAGPAISGALTRLQCCPIGEGAAAVLVVSDEAIEERGIDRSRCVRVLASVQRSEELYGSRSFDAELTRATAELAYDQAAISPGDLDLVELHDAFSIEELQYVEAMGLVGEGQAASALADGRFSRGGTVAVNTSGGVLGSGHPIGRTGVGQIGEIATQIRGETGPRQHPGARTGLAHMVGLGAVCVATVLQGTPRPTDAIGVAPM
jgi:AMP-binding enzyme/Thiolase, C-terminal domain